MKRLFSLKEPSGRLFQGIPRENGPLCFASKPEAKTRRDEINQNRPEGDKVHVTYGPDHYKF